MCSFHGGRKTEEPGEKLSKHGRDQLQQVRGNALTTNYWRYEQKEGLNFHAVNTPNDKGQEN